MIERVPTLALNRIRTEVPGLDVTLGGGFLRGGVYMVVGRPGVGKTILGNQLCYRHVSSGGRAVYVTLLSESHARLIAHQSTLEFFDAERIGVSLFYISGYEALEKDKIKGLLDLVRSVVREHKATLLVIDGLVTAGAIAQSELDLKKFIHELQVFVELVGCTTILLTGVNTNDEQYPMRTMVDGLLRLVLEPTGMGAIRTLEVMKFRGGANLLGRHFFEITSAGIAVHPRTEAVVGRSWVRTEGAPKLLPFGVHRLDEMLGGGIPTGSLTMLFGSPGSGKTLLGTSFLAAGARQKERGLYFGFFETPTEITRKAQAIGADFAHYLKSGVIDVIWQPPFEVIADAIAERLLSAVKKQGVRRLFIDGLGGLESGLVYRERLGGFLGALANELRALGVATILSAETAGFWGPEVEAPLDRLTAILDNVILLRHVELRARLHRLISVMKLREGVGDPSLREFTIGKHGIDVAPTFETAEAILTGVARVANTSPPRSSKRPTPAKGRPKTRRSP